MVWNRKKKLKCSYSHHGLGHSGEHSRPERVQQDLVLQQDKVQQCGAVLRAQIHQQSPVVCPADGGGGGRAQRV